jgi:hypothetical protein
VTSSAAVVPSVSNLRKAYWYSLVLLPSHLLRDHAVPGAPQQGLPAWLNALHSAALGSLPGRGRNAPHLTEDDKAWTTSVRRSGKIPVKAAPILGHDDGPLDLYGRCRRAVHLRRPLSATSRSEFVLVYHVAADATTTRIAG